MARAKSPEKRQAILDSAIRAIAQTGLGASTASIAKGAEIAEGTLFTYFATKDDLFNELYVELKTEAYRRINTGFPHDARLRDRVRHIWNQYLHWAIEAPEARKVSVQLNLCAIVSAKTRARMSSQSEAIMQTMNEVSKRGAFEQLPPGFAFAAISALQEAVMEMVAKEPKQKAILIEGGFSAFWQMTK